MKILFAIPCLFAVFSIVQGDLSNEYYRYRHGGGGGQFRGLLTHLFPPLGHLVPGTYAHTIYNNLIPHVSYLLHRLMRVQPVLTRQLPQLIAAPQISVTGGLGGGLGGGVSTLLTQLLGSLQPTLQSILGTSYQVPLVIPQTQYLPQQYSVQQPIVGGGGGVQKLPAGFWNYFVSRLHNLPGSDDSSADSDDASFSDLDYKK